MKHWRYCLSTWFTRSDCPSVWGWKAVESLTFVLRMCNRHCQKCKVNWGSRSEIASPGMLWSQMTWFKIKQAVSGRVIVLLQAMKWAIFVRWSMMTRTESFPWIRGKSVMKSRVTDPQGRSGMGRVCSRLQGLCHGAFALEQVS